MGLLKEKNVGRLMLARELDAKNGNTLSLPTIIAHRDVPLLIAFGTPAGVKDERHISPSFSNHINWGGYEIRFKRAHPGRSPYIIPLIRVRDRRRTRVADGVAGEVEAVRRRGGLAVDLVELGGKAPALKGERARRPPIDGVSQ